LRDVRTVWMRVTLVIVVCFSAVGVVQADNIGTLYTGIFPISTNGNSVWTPWLLQVGGTLLGNTQTVDYVVTFSATIADFQLSPPCGPDCPRYFSGDLKSGSMSFSGISSLGQDPYNFIGPIAPGGSIIGEVTCDTFGCVWNESVFVSFSGRPSNGWESLGFMILDGGDDGSGGGDSGLLNMVTNPTPEPNSIALFGAGMFGSFGALRRRLKG
jgi:PEP-CTERM motif